jgi:ribosomal protein L16/L10AE
MFELGGVTEEMARYAFNRIAYKIPVSVVFVKRRVSI